MPHCAARSGLLIQRRKLQPCLALCRRRGLEQIEVAAARRAAALLARRQHGDAEGKLRIGADVRQVARGGPDHRHLLFQKITRRRPPIDNARRMRLILSREIDPVAQRLDTRGAGEVGLCAIGVGQRAACLGGERLEQPIREAAGGDLHAPPLHGVAAPPGQLLRERGMLVPGGRRTLRIQSGILKRRLVPVQHDGRALERHAPGVAIDFAVLQERRIEAAQPGAIRIAGRQRVERHDQVVVDQGKRIGGQQHRELRTRLSPSVAVCALVMRILIACRRRSVSP